MFSTYHLENVNTHQVVVLDHASYLGAALFASFYVCCRTDFAGFRKALPINVAFLIVSALAVFTASLLPGHLALILAIAAPSILAITQSRLMIRCICRHYARRGWTVTRT